MNNFCLKSTQTNSQTKACKSAKFANTPIKMMFHILLDRFNLTI